VISYPTSPNYCLCITWGNMNPGNCVFSAMLYTVFRKRNGYARNNICTRYLIIRPYCLQKIIKIGWWMSKI